MSVNANVVAALPNIGSASVQRPQSLADAPCPDAKAVEITWGASSEIRTVQTGISDWPRAAQAPPHACQSPPRPRPGLPITAQACADWFQEPRPH